MAPVLEFWHKGISVWCVWAGGDSLFCVGVCCKLLTSQVLFRGSERMDVMDNEIRVIVRGVVHILPAVTICSVFITAECITADTNTFNNRMNVYCNYLN